MGSISNILQKVNKNRKDSTTKLENIFRSKPKKVDYIPSKTIATFNADADENPTIKIEQYDSYRSISCNLDSSDFTLLNMGSGFSQLTAFVLGNNNYSSKDDDEEGSSSTIIADRVTTPFIMHKSKMWIKCVQYGRRRET